MESIQALVEVGADANAQNNLTGATPLHMIVQSNKPIPFHRRITIIKLLIEKGKADVTISDQYGTLPIDSLDRKGSTVYTDTEMNELKKLLSSDRPIVFPPIYVAMIERNVDSLKNIVTSETEAVNVEFDGRTPISYIVDEIVQCILNNDNSQQNVESAAETKSTTLDDTPQEDITKLVEILEFLLQNGSNPNIVPKPRKKNDDDDDASLPLYKLVSTLREVYRNSAKPMDSSNDNNDTAILKKVITLLLNTGAEIQDDTKKLLHQLSRFGEIEMVEFLITVLQIDPNTIGPQGMTPLHFAARSGRYDVVVRNIENEKKREKEWVYQFTFFVFRLYCSFQQQKSQRNESIP